MLSLAFRLFSNVLLCAELGVGGCEDGFLKRVDNLPGNQLLGP